MYVDLAGIYEVEDAENSEVVVVDTKWYSNGISLEADCTGLIYAMQSINMYQM